GASKCTDDPPDPSASWQIPVEHRGYFSAFSLILSMGTNILGPMHRQGAIVAAASRGAVACGASGGVRSPGDRDPPPGHAPRVLLEEHRRRLVVGLEGVHQGDEMRGERAALCRTESLETR